MNIILEIIDIYITADERVVNEIIVVLKIIEGIYNAIVFDKNKIIIITDGTIQ